MFLYPADLKFLRSGACNSYEFVTDDNGVTTLKVFVRPHKHHSNLCPICGKKCSVYDRNQHCRKWRDLDSSNGTIVEIYSQTQRICCPEHGVKTASVPWAFSDSGFTKNFDLMATFLAMNINRSVAAQYLRCDWHTIMNTPRSMLRCGQLIFISLCPLGQVPTTCRVSVIGLISSIRRRRIT